MRKSFINWKGHLVLLVMFCIATCVFFYLWIFVFVVFVFTYFFFIYNFHVYVCLFVCFYFFVFFIYVVVCYCFGFFLVKNWKKTICNAYFFQLLTYCWKIFLLNTIFLLIIYLNMVPGQWSLKITLYMYL